MSGPESPYSKVRAFPEEVAVIAIGRWLPAVGVAVGLGLMTVAMVAQGQPATDQPTPESIAPAAGPGDDGDGSPMHHNWHRHGHRGFMAMAPGDRCKEGYAREAGFLAYLGARLDLSAQQQPLWDKYHQAMLDSAGKQRQVCLDNVSATQADVSALQRRDHIEKFLTARLDALHATRPSLEALYQSLTPEQRALLDHPRGPGRGPEPRR